MSSNLKITGLTHRYPGSRNAALEDVSFTLPAGEILALIGASGGGKSTLLRLIAGLEIPRCGSIALDGKNMAGIPPERRQVGMVSQGGDLFPHLSVLKNVLYGLRRVPRSERQKRAMDALDHVGLSALAKRFPAELSGGEAQRVALARALAPQPRVLLLDEPFSSLDSSLRDRLRQLTVDLLRQENVTAIFVTHHGEDALAVGDRIGVVESGRLVQMGTPVEVWKNPASASVASLLGPVNLVFISPGAAPRLLRPEDLTVCKASPDCLACGEIVRCEFRGTHRQISIRLPDRDTPVLVRTESGAIHLPGEKVGIRAR